MRKTAPDASWATRPNLCDSRPMRRSWLMRCSICSRSEADPKRGGAADTLSQRRGRCAAARPIEAAARLPAAARPMRGGGAGRQAAPVRVRARFNRVHGWVRACRPLRRAVTMARPEPTQLGPARIISPLSRQVWGRRVPVGGPDRPRPGSIWPGLAGQPGPGGGSL